MQGANALSERSATADEVLEFFRADHRLRIGLDPEVDEGPELTAGTTIAEWRAACDLVPAAKLARSMNEWFGMDRPVTEWRAVLTPDRTRSLGELATFIASHTRWPRSSPVVIGGARDAAAGAFFAMRSLLAKRGVAVRELRPSTPIRPRHVVALGEAVARLAPGLVPAPRITHSRLGTVGGTIALAGLSVTILGVAVLSLPALALGSLALVGGHSLARAGEQLTFGEFRTLGDIARAIGGHRG